MIRIQILKLTPEWLSLGRVAKHKFTVSHSQIDHCSFLKSVVSARIQPIFPPPAVSSLRYIANVQKNLFVLSGLSITLEISLVLDFDIHIYTRQWELLAKQERIITDDSGRFSVILCTKCQQIVNELKFRLLSQVAQLSRACVILKWRLQAIQLFVIDENCTLSKHCRPKFGLYIFVQALEGRKPWLIWRNRCMFLF